MASAVQLTWKAKGKILGALGRRHEGWGLGGWCSEALGELGLNHCTGGRKRRSLARFLVRTDGRTEILPCVL